MTNRLTDFELAQKMENWRLAKETMDDLAEEIQNEILLRQSTFTMGNLRCTYSGGARTFFWEKSARAHPQFTPELEQSHTELIQSTKTDWKAVANELGITTVNVTHTKSSPKATMKQLK